MGRTTPIITAIAAEADAQGVSKAELARRCGFSPQVCGLYLAGAKQPTAPVIQRMLDALGMMVVAQRPINGRSRRA